MNKFSRYRNFNIKKSTYLLVTKLLINILCLAFLMSVTSSVYLFVLFSIFFNIFGLLSILQDRAEREENENI